MAVTAVVKVSASNEVSGSVLRFSVISERAQRAEQNFDNLPHPICWHWSSLFQQLEQVVIIFADVAPKHMLASSAAQTSGKSLHHYAANSSIPTPHDLQ